MKKLIILTTVFLFAVLTAASVSATAPLPSNVYVSPTGDDANDGLTPSTAVQTINAGIDKVAENGQVNLAAGIYNKTGETSKDVNITISKNLTIAGAGKNKTIIDGLGLSQIFEIDSGTVIIKDITFQNGKLDNAGGAISSDGILTVKNCIFKDNAAVDDGGGAIFTHTTLNVVDCIFTGNRADAGGAIFNKGGSITVTGSTFIDNRAGSDLDKYSGGGAIFNYYDSSFKIIGNTFMNNVGSAVHIASKEPDEDDESAEELLALINFNRIVGNTPYGIYLGNGKDLNKASPGESQGPAMVVDATNNWWGSNSNPKNNPANIGGDIEHVLADPWLVLTISSSPSTVPYGSTAEVFAAITQNSNGEDTSSMGHIPDGTPITITTDIGNVGSKSVTKYTVNGIATAILRADEGFGVAHLYAVLDGFKTPVPSQAVITQAAAVKSKGSNTISLQETGLPLVGLVLAILAVFSGLVMPKRK